MAERAGGRTPYDTVKEQEELKKIRVLYNLYRQVTQQQEVLFQHRNTAFVTTMAFLIVAFLVSFSVTTLQAYVISLRQWLLVAGIFVSFLWFWTIWRAALSIRDSKEVLKAIEADPLFLKAYGYGRAQIYTTKSRMYLGFDRANWTLQVLPPLFILYWAITDLILGFELISYATLILLFILLFYLLFKQNKKSTPSLGKVT